MVSPCVHASAHIHRNDTAQVYPPVHTLKPRWLCRILSGSWLGRCWNPQISNPTNLKHTITPPISTAKQENTHTPTTWTSSLGLPLIVLLVRPERCLARDRRPVQFAKLENMLPVTGAEFEMIAVDLGLRTEALPMMTLFDKVLKGPFVVCSWKQSSYLENRCYRKISKLETCQQNSQS